MAKKPRNQKATDIDSFEAVMTREDRTKGFFVAFNFSSDALPECTIPWGEGAVQVQTSSLALFRLSNSFRSWYNPSGLRGNDMKLMPVGVLLMLLPLQAVSRAAEEADQNISAIGSTQSTIESGSWIMVSDDGGESYHKVAVPSSVQHPLVAPPVPKTDLQAQPTTFSPTAEDDFSTGALSVVFHSATLYFLGGINEKTLEKTITYVEDSHGYLQKESLSEAQKVEFKTKAIRLMKSSDDPAIKALKDKGITSFPMTLATLPPAVQADDNFVIASVFYITHGTALYLLGGVKRTDFEDNIVTIEKTFNTFRQAKVQVRKVIASGTTNAQILYMTEEILTDLGPAERKVVQSIVEADEKLVTKLKAKGIEVVKQ